MPRQKFQQRPLIMSIGVLVALTFGLSACSAVSETPKDDDKETNAVVGGLKDPTTIPEAPTTTDPELGGEESEAFWAKHADFAKILDSHSYTNISESSREQIETYLTTLVPGLVFEEFEGAMELISSIPRTDFETDEATFWETLKTDGWNVLEERVIFSPGVVRQYAVKDQLEITVTRTTETVNITVKEISK